MSPRTKKIAGIALLGLGISGFIGTNVAKSRSAITQERVTNLGARRIAVPVSTGTQYTVSVWGRDEETGFSPAGLEASYRVLDTDGTSLLHEKTLSASAHSSNETGGIKRAQTGGEFSGVAHSDGQWTVAIQLKTGDEVTVDVYRDLPRWLHLAPGLSILVGLVGVVFLLKARAGAS